MIAVSHSLRGEGFDASEDGTGRGTPVIPVQCNGSNIGVGLPSLRRGNGGLTSGVPAIAFSSKDHGADAGAISPTLRAMGHDGSHANAGGQMAVAFSLRGRDGGVAAEASEIPSSLRASQGGGDKAFVATDYAVRRLTPVECERLQGFTDQFTAIPWRGKPADQCPDGPRYKALGNSMAVPCMRWLGERINMVVGMAGP